MVILSTSKGERVIDPDFGCWINDLVYEVVSPKLLSLAEMYVREALILHEPRIDVVNVKVSQDDAKLGKLLIDITYIVRPTESMYNMVLPFYLEMEEGFSYLDEWRAKKLGEINQKETYRENKN